MKFVPLLLSLFNLSIVAASKKKKPAAPAPDAGNMPAQGNMGDMPAQGATPQQA